MRSRNWQAMAVAGLTAFALACGGGDQPAEDTSGAMEQDAPAQQEMGAEDTGAMEQQAAELPEGVTQEMVTQGQRLFTGAGGCQACHSADATGTQLGPDLTDSEWLNVSGRNYDEIVSLIKTGVPQPKEHPGPMSPMGGANLTDAQVDALAAYVVSLGS